MGGDPAPNFERRAVGGAPWSRGRVARIRARGEDEDALRRPDTDERTALIRMEPGSSCPAHDHEQAEECFVLEGSINIDGEDYRSGDHIIAPAGSRHGVVASVPGGLLLIHYNAHASPGAAA